MRNRKFVKSSVVSIAMLIFLYALPMHSTNALNGDYHTALRGEPPADAAAIFGARCASCHGKDGRGLPNWKSKGQPDFTDARYQKSRTDAQIAEAIRNGKGRFMPGWKGKLSEDEITALVGRVRAFGKK